MNFQKPITTLPERVQHETEPVFSPKKFVIGGSQAPFPFSRLFCNPKASMGYQVYEERETPQAAGFEWHNSMANMSTSLGPNGNFHNLENCVFLEGNPGNVGGENMVVEEVKPFIEVNDTRGGPIVQTPEAPMDTEPEVVMTPEELAQVEQVLRNAAMMDGLGAEWEEKERMNRNMEEKSRRDEIKHLVTLLRAKLGLGEKASRKETFQKAKVRLGTLLGKPYETVEVPVVASPSEAQTVDLETMRAHKAAVERRNRCIEKLELEQIRNLVFERESAASRKQILEKTIRVLSCARQKA